MQVVRCSIGSNTTGTMSQLLLLFVLPFIALTESRSVHNLTFMFVTSFGRSEFNASGIVLAADIALEDINSHPDVLQGYHLMYDEVRDSQVGILIEADCGLNPKGNHPNTLSEVPMAPIYVLSTTIVTDIRT